MIVSVRVPSMGWIDLSEIISIRLEYLKPYYWVQINDYYRQIKKAVFLKCYGTLKI